MNGELFFLNESIFLADHPFNSLFFFSNMFKPVDEHKQLSEIEREVLQFWEEKQAFQTSLKQSEGKPEYIFYDGPPFATGLPHYGHILAGTIKDVVTRYAHQTGHHVERRFGWDTHGLPVEHEIDKANNITDRAQILEMGIDVYNEKCRSIVMRYQEEWERIIKRTGRWIDFKNSYKTMDITFMESIWWVFKQLWEKDLVYRGVKVMPYSTGCKTPLSNFEAQENYMNVSDPCITAAFKVPGKDFEFVAWTTTPWTLPSNLALAVNPKFTYCKVVDDTTKRVFVMMKDRLGELFNMKKKTGFTILEEFLGSTLVGIQYEPLFPYFSDWASEGAFRVIAADYVTNEDGTGIVHIAPGFGEDDFNACMKSGIIKKGGKIVCPIDDNGCFTSEVSDFKGVYVKDADKSIIERLKAEKKLVKQGTIAHNYPYCWRSDTPLIYRAVPSWFVRIEPNREKLIQNTLETHWVPQSIRDGRFITWLQNARDWAISRNRYWGTPIPIWTDEEYSEFVVVGSVQELKDLTGNNNITDIHMHKIDDLTITSKKTGKVLHRIPEVFDCWFESGSMPFSQNHIPFSGKEWKQADFIAEGLDQTRGWFYTLTILSTLLGHKSPFQHLIVNGLILAEDGKKMSKRARNYPDPEFLIESKGADALRLYLVNSPAVHADPMRFKEDGVKQVVRDVMLPWFNSIKFFVQQVLRHGNKFQRNAQLAASSDNPLDKWILSRLHRIIKFVHSEMEVYRLYTVLPELVKFIDEMTNWYVRLNRDRLKSQDNETGLAVFFEVLYNISLMMAPFAPFFAEYAYQALKPGIPQSEVQDSIHYLMLPKPDESLIIPAIEYKIQCMQSAICIARAVRDRKRILVRKPLAELIIVCSEEIKKQLVDLENYIVSEIHVLKISFDTNEKKYVKFQAVADGRILGKRLGKNFAVVNKALKDLSYEMMADLYEKSIEATQKGQPAPTFEVAGQTVNTDEVKLTREFVNPDPKVYDGGVDNNICAICNIQDNELINEIMTAREVRNRVQQARKKLGLQPTDKVNIFISVPEGNKVWDIIHCTKPEIVSALNLQIQIGEPKEGDIVGALDFAVDDINFKITILRA